MPSFAVLGLSGSELMAASYTFVSPSPSASADGLLERTVKVLFEPASWLELPAKLVATTVKEPKVVPESVRLIVADVPSGLMLTLLAVIAGGVKAGRNEKLAPPRLTPLTWKLFTGVPCTAEVGLIDVITGT